MKDSTLAFGLGMFDIGEMGAEEDRGALPIFR